MKKAFLALALASALGCAGPAAATAACDGTGVKKKIAPANPVGFVETEFDVKCSANVHSEYAENADAFGVVAASSKGKNVFSGGSNSGSVKGDKCASDPCTAAGDVTNSKAVTARESTS